MIITKGRRGRIARTPVAYCPGDVARPLANDLRQPVTFKSENKALGHVAQEREVV